MPTAVLDRTDRKILELLQRDGRLTNVELAAKVALSPEPAACGGCGRSRRGA